MRLLVVEDDTKMAAAVKRGLEAEGFDVAVASDGLDGLWMATEHHFDLIVLDAPPAAPGWGRPSSATSSRATAAPSPRWTPTPPVPTSWSACPCGPRPGGRSRSVWPSVRSAEDHVPTGS